MCGWSYSLFIVNCNSFVIVAFWASSLVYLNNLVVAVPSSNQSIIHDFYMIHLNASFGLIGHFGILKFLLLWHIISHKEVENFQVRFLTKIYHPNIDKVSSKPNYV